MNSYMNSQLDPFLESERERNVERFEHFYRGQIVAICEAVLAEEVGVIAASRRLSLLGLTLFESHDPDFGTFDLISSDTDGLPVDRERHNWSVEALERKDKEIADAEMFYKERAFEACRKLSERFGLSDDASNR